MLRVPRMFLQGIHIEKLKIKAERKRILHGSEPYRISKMFDFCFVRIRPRKSSYNQREYCEDARDS